MRTAIAPQIQRTARGVRFVLRRGFLSVLCLALFVLGCLMLHKHLNTTVTKLLVSGEHRRVEPHEVLEALRPLGVGRYFEIDLKAAQSLAEKMPWVAHARVDRQWPDRIAVAITERQEVAHWGENQALSNEGVIYEIGDASISDELPWLDGAENREREVFEMFAPLSDRLAETPLAIIGLSRDSRGEWRARTANDIILRFGRNSPLDDVERIRNTVAPTLAPHIDTVASIDLRHTNGFAVAWHQPSPTALVSDAVPESSNLDRVVSEPTLPAGVVP